MSEPLDKLQASLASNGFSLTKPRKLVFKALQAKEPQTMHELVAGCQTIDRASIYRTVAVFEQLGIVQRLQIGWKYRIELSDSFVHHHHHLSCSKCGKVTALPEDTVLESRLLTLAKQHAFQAQDHQLEISGICKDCMNG